MKFRKKHTIRNWMSVVFSIKVNYEIGSFILLIFSAFFMNLFLWNETIQLIRQLPIILQLKKLSSQNIYEVNYLPEVDSQGRIKEHSEEERNNLAFFLASFQTDLYSNKRAYLDAGDNDATNLTLVTKKVIDEYVVAREIDIAFLNDLIFLNPDNKQVNEFKTQSENNAIKVSLLSMKERYKVEYDYYVNNFLFGLTVSLLR
ncbi:hypothetical protein [Enterococcus lemanii]|uniref:Uncharacterized protein n=1 Tax=Enterococcus lemanii TaxID=1159752 RepID=A0ABV9N221_9ENTE